MQIQFANPWLLYSLWLAPAVGAWWFAVNRRREAVLDSLISPAMQQKLRPTRSTVRSTWQAILFAAGTFLALFAAARPQWGQREETVFQRGRDLIIALDVSRSMLATDVHPNRLERAKTDILDLIKELQGDRAALLAFRRTATLLCPLTTDYAFLRQSLESVGPDSAPRGATDIGDAIEKSIAAFENEGSHKAIVLISDGEDLSEQALAAAADAAKKNIPIFTVGLGSRAGALIPAGEQGKGFIQYRGEDVRSRLNNETLLAIAKATKGVYIPIETASTTSTTLGTLYRDYLRNISAQDIQESIQRRYIERYQLFLLPAVLLLLTGMFLSRGRLATGQPAAPRRDKTDARAPLAAPGGQPPPLPASSARPALALLLAAGLAIGTAAAQDSTNTPAAGAAAVSTTNGTATTPALDVPPGREGARIAQQLYGAGKYAESAQAYLAAVRGASPEAQRDYRFNAAAALFRAARYREAADLLREILPRDKAREADTALALGSALYRAGASLPAENAGSSNATERAALLREASESFREAARVERNQDTARRNLAVSILALRDADEQAKIARLTEQYESTPPDQLADEMLQNQRRMNLDAFAAFGSTNPLPRRIQQLEELAQQQNDNADLWIPLKGKLLSAFAQQGRSADQQQLAQVTRHIEATRENMRAAAGQLRDLDPESTRSGALAEAATYALWKGIASYGSLLAEDLRRQTNAVLLTKAASNLATNEILPRLRQEQSEALSLTGLFVDRFTNAVPPQGTQPAATNAPAAGGKAGAPPPAKGISAEDRQKIVKLAGQAVTAQTNAVLLLNEPSLQEAAAQEAEAHRLLKEIRDLLPKEQSQSQQQQQNRKEDQKESEPRQQQQNEQKQQEQEPQPQPDPEQKQQEQKQAEPKDEKQKLDAEQLQRLLQRALQREREHEEEKRQLQQYVTPSPIDRDW